VTGTGIRGWDSRERKASDAVRHSLLAVSGLYRVRSDGDLQFDGMHPVGG